MGGLGEDVTVRRKDVPAQREPDLEDAGSALPEVVMAQLLD